MSFKLIKKENNDINKNNNELNPISEENGYNKLNKLIINNEETNNINKINIELNNNFDSRKEKFRMNRDVFKRLMKNKTQGELKNFRNNSYKKFFEVKKNANTLNTNSKFNLSINQTFGYFDREQIKNEIYNIKKEMKIIDDELNHLKEKEKEAENKFIANKIIIEKVLKISEKKEENIKQEENNKNEENNNIEEKKEVNNIDNKNKKGNNITSLYLTQLVNSDITKDETKEENINEELLILNNIENQNQNNKKNKIKSATCIKKKKNKIERIRYIKIKNRMKVNNFNRLVMCLKRENSDYDKSIESTSKLIESKKKSGKVNAFLNLNSFIENKNKNLEELYLKRNSLFDTLNENNRKICSIMLKTKKLIEEQRKAEKIINSILLVNESYKRAINNLNSDKEKYNNEIKILEEEKNDIMKKKGKKDDEKKELEEVIKYEEEIYKEKYNNIKESDDIDNKEKVTKKIIAKNEMNIKKFKNNIKDSEKTIQLYSNYIKLYEDYLQINQEIKNIKQNNTNYKETEKKQEISKTNLNNKLKQLSNELTEKNNLCKKLNEELNELKKEYQTKVKNIEKAETEVQKEENKTLQENIETPRNPNNIEEKEEIKENGIVEEKEISDDKNGENKVENKEENKEDKKDCMIF